VRQSSSVIAVRHPISVQSSRSSQAELAVLMSSWAKFSQLCSQFVGLASELDRKQSASECCRLVTAMCS